MTRILAIAALCMGLVGAVADDKDKADHPAKEHAFVIPAEIKWGPTPPALPPGGQAALLTGDPGKAGAPYVLRVKLPNGYKVPPHWHSHDENVTVLKGALLIGKGDKLDPEAMKELPTGGFMRMPRKMHHSAMAKGETILQLHGIGPFDIYYVNPEDDPRKKSKD